MLEFLPQELVPELAIHAMQVAVVLRCLFQLDIHVVQLQLCR